ncbi:MAG: SlyX protein [Marinosulfonomonas sp.]|nr:MAG: SlyX protein [Marinosulfonomonas sp.]
MTNQVTNLEEAVAHLSQVVDDLSDIIARQEKEITTLKRRVGMLMEREAGREVAEGGTVPLGDEKPPHW